MHSARKFSAKKKEVGIIDLFHIETQTIHFVKRDTHYIPAVLGTVFPKRPMTTRPEKRQTKQLPFTKKIAKNKSNPHQIHRNYIIGTKKVLKSLIK